MGREGKQSGKGCPISCTATVKSATGQNYWSAAVITQQSLGGRPPVSICKCQRGCNPAASPLASVNALLDVWLELIAYCLNVVGGVFFALWGENIWNVNQK